MPGRERRIFFAVGAEFTFGDGERLLGEIAAAVPVGGDVGPVLGIELGLFELGLRDGFEKLDLESAGDVTEGDHFIKVGGEFVGLAKRETLEAVGWLGVFAGFGEELPKAAVTDVTEVIVLIGAFDDAVGPRGETGDACAVVAAGVEEDGTLPNAFDFFEEDAVEAAEGDIAEEPLAVVDGERSFEVFQDDGLAGGAVDDALWKVNGGRGLVAGAAGIGVDGFGLEGGGVGVVLFKKVVAVEGTAGEADEFV